MVIANNGTIKARTEKVLLVDDDPNILNGLKRQLKGRFLIDTAGSGDEALAKVAQDGPFAVVVTDMRMPGMNGVELLEKLRNTARDTVRMMLTGNADQQTAVDAVNTGALFRFMNKPCSAETLAKGIEDGIHQYRLITAERVLLEKTLTGSIKVLIDILTLLDPEGFSQGTKIRKWVRKVAGEADIPDSWQVELAAMLSRLGEVVIPREVVERKRAGQPLSLAERAMFAQIPETGRDLLQNIPRMREVAEIVYYQSKAFNGDGFPKNAVRGNDIPRGARLLKILNDLEAMTPEDEPTVRDFYLLQGHWELYDPALLKAVHDAFIDENDLEALKQEEIAEVKVEQIEAGDVLRSNVELVGGQLVLAEGAEVTHTQLARFRNLSKIKKFKGPVLVVKRQK